MAPRYSSSPRTASPSLAERLQAYASMPVKGTALTLGALAATVPAVDVQAQGCTGGTLQNDVCYRSINQRVAGFGTVNVDFDGAGQVDLSIRVSTFYASLGQGGNANGVIASGPNYVRPLAPGYSISAKRPFSAGFKFFTYFGKGPWAVYPGQDRFVGARLNFGSPASHFGWVRVQYNGMADLTVVDAAYNTQANAALPAGEDGSSLAVELAALTARAEGDAAVIEWTTGSETDNAGFEIQHRAADGAWEARGFVEGAGTTQASQRYAHRVDGLAPGRHLFRLRQLDLDGGASVSATVEVSIDVPGTHALSDAYPNPFNPRARFSLAVDQTQQVRVAVYNVLGQVVAVLHDGELVAGTNHTFTLDAERWPSGTYVYRVDGERFSESRTVVLQK